jgi:hypothetical protein
MKEFKLYNQISSRSVMVAIVGEAMVEAIQKPHAVSA